MNLALMAWRGWGCRSPLLRPGALTHALPQLTLLPRRYRLAFGTSDKLQTASLVSAFHAVRLHLLKEKAGAA